MLNDGKGNHKRTYATNTLNTFIYYHYTMEYTITTDRWTIVVTSAKDEDEAIKIAQVAMDVDEVIIMIETKTTLKSNPLKLTHPKATTFTAELRTENRYILKQWDEIITEAVVIDDLYAMWFVTA